MALTPRYGPLYQGANQFGWSPAAQPSGRSWLDPDRMEERKIRREDRAARVGGGGGGGGGGRGAVAEGPKPLFTNATTGVQYFFNAADSASGSAARRYGAGRVAALGGSVEPSVTAYDPRTGMTNQQSLNMVDPAILKQMFPVDPGGLLNMAPRSRGTDNARRSFLSGLYKR